MSVQTRSMTKTASASVTTSATSNEKSTKYGKGNVIRNFNDVDIQIYLEMEQPIKSYFMDALAYRNKMCTHNKLKIIESNVLFRIVRESKLFKEKYIKISKPIEGNLLHNCFKYRYYMIPIEEWLEKSGLTMEESRNLNWCYLCGDFYVNETENYIKLWEYSRC